MYHSVTLLLIWTFLWWKLASITSYSLEISIMKIWIRISLSACLFLPFCGPDPRPGHWWLMLRSWRERYETRIAYDGIYIFASFWNMVPLLEKYSIKKKATNSVLINNQSCEIWLMCEQCSLFLAFLHLISRIKYIFYKAQFTVSVFTVNLSFHLCCFYLVSPALHLSITPSSILLFLFCSALPKEHVLSKCFLISLEREKNKASRKENQEERGQSCI